MSSYLNYELPEERIAQRPLSVSGRRDQSKLLHAAGSKEGLCIADCSFSFLPQLLQPGDLLVLNDSKVLHCRFFARNSRNDREVEVLLLREEISTGGKRVFEALARPMRRLKEGDNLKLSDHLVASVLGRNEDETLIRLELETLSEKAVDQLIEAEGFAPIPPYIRRGHSDDLDKSVYQTVFAANPGSVAAPTAGLHFTDELLLSLKKIGIEVGFVTLHVGPASFLPVRSSDLAQHKMPKERYEVPESTRRMILNAKRNKQRVVAVGTTVVRTLESAALSEAGLFSSSGGAWSSDTQLLISPGFEFKVIDLLVTNFHQPGSTHLLLVAAFIGENETRRIYDHALSSDYRFLSYGDAMLLDPRGV